MGRVAAAADDDLVGQIFAAYTAAGVFHELRLLAGDEFDSRGRRQIELIAQSTGPLDKSLQVRAPWRVPDFANHEPAGRKADRQLARDRLPPEHLDRQPDAVGKQVPYGVAVFGQHLPAAAKVFPVEFNWQQAPPRRQESVARLVVKDLAATGRFALLDREVHAPLAGAPNF